MAHVVYLQKVSLAIMVRLIMTTPSFAKTSRLPFQTLKNSYKILPALHVSEENIQRVIM